MDHFTADPAEIRHIGGLCLKRVDMKRRLRLLGVRVGTLVKADSEQAHAPMGRQPFASKLSARESTDQQENRHAQTDLF